MEAASRIGVYRRAVGAIRGLVALTEERDEQRLRKSISHELSSALDALELHDLTIVRHRPATGGLPARTASTESAAAQPDASRWVTLAGETAARELGPATNAEDSARVAAREPHRPRVDDVEIAAALIDVATLVLELQTARREHARLAEEARTDALTGVASRSVWEQALRTEERHQPRTNLPATVAIVDLDGLKEVNDQQGHAAGDELLSRCARLLADSVRSTDVVARIGGDEFGVLLRYTDPEQAQTWRERLDATVNAEGYGQLRWSLGCASTPPQETVAAALREADRLMYEMKLARRSASP